MLWGEGKDWIGVLGGEGEDWIGVLGGEGGGGGGEGLRETRRQPAPQCLWY